MRSHNVSISNVPSRIIPIDKCYTCTDHLAAVNERVKVAVTSYYFYGIKEARLYMLNCDRNYVPGMWNLADMGDLSALIAPRSFFVETGDTDPLNGASVLPNVKRQLE